jgi:aspartyl-tRNA(Asn)/glutamyl-tRNA(Gln) amidotransferase subunit A
VGFVNMPAREERLRELADEMAMPVDEEAIEEVLTYVEELETVFDERLSAPEESAESVGSWSDDEYNALLAVYDEPRSETDGGPLDDVTVAIKDNTAVRGLPMTCGSEEFRYVPSFDASVVERLLDDGASIVGKANMDAFAFGPAGQWSEFGRVHNPIAEDRVPGGSSSGSGAAVAGGLVDAALGSDTGGSVRVPAACCGLVGVKPTHGLVPRYGFAGNIPFTDTIGPLAGEVETAARVLESIAGPDPRDPRSLSSTGASVVTDLNDPGHMTVGYIENTPDLVDDEVAAVIDDLADDLEARGDVTVDRVELEFSDAVDYAFSIIYGADYAWMLRQNQAIHGEGSGYNIEWTRALREASFNTHISKRALPGALLDEITAGESYVAAREIAVEFTRRLNDLFGDVDVLLTSTLRMLPPKYGQIESSKEGLKYSLCKPFSLTGAPAVSIPADTVDGLPVSAQFLAPAFDDGKALQCARLVERMRD